MKSIVRLYTVRTSRPIAQRGRGVFIPFQKRWERMPVCSTTYRAGNVQPAAASAENKVVTISIFIRGTTTIQTGVKRSDSWRSRR